MIYITQLIYIKEGKEKVFNEFECIAIPLIPKYNGKMLFRLRPSENDFIEHSIEKPYEIHLVWFPTKDDLDSFMKDESRKQILYLKEESIKEVILINGSKLN